MKLTKKLLRQLISEEMDKSDLLSDDDELETGEVDFGDDGAEEDDDVEGFVVGDGDDDGENEMEPGELPSEPADAFGMGYAAGELGLADEEPGVIDDEPEGPPEETDGEGEKYGHGGRSTMAKSHLFNLIQDAQELYGNLRDEDTLPEWAQSKIAVMSSKMDAVSDWLGYKMHKKKNN